MFEGEVQFVVVGSGICFLPDGGGGSTEGVDEAGMVADPEPDWIRIQSDQWILTRIRVREVTQGRYGGWVGGRRVDPD